MKKKKQKRRKNSPCAAKSTRTSGKICCNILSSRYDGLNLKCQFLIDEIFRNAWNILEKYTLSLSFSSPLFAFSSFSLSFPFSFSLCCVVCCGSRGSSADEFSYRDWSLGEAFGWCLIWTPHSSSLLADLWPHRKALPGEHTWFLLSVAVVLANTCRSSDDTVVEHTRCKESFYCLVAS